MTLVCRGKGQAAALAAAEGCITLVTSRAYLLRYDYQQKPTPGRCCLFTSVV